MPNRYIFTDEYCDGFAANGAGVPREADPYGAKAQHWRRYDWRAGWDDAERLAAELARQ